MSKSEIISAKEAYSLTGYQSIKTTLKELDTLIRNAAEEGETRIRIPYNLCRRVTAYELTLRSQKLYDILREAGYELISKYEDGGFLSDVWLELSWESREGVNQNDR